MQLFPALPEVVQGIFRPAPFGRLERRGGGPCERGIFIVDHTTNYQLSQWETTDRILMSDFNADNAKIDAALKANADAISAEATARTAAVSAKADTSALNAETSARQAADNALAEKAGLQLIHTEVLSSATAWMSVDFRGFDWTQWHTVHILFQPAPGSITYETYINSQSSNDLCSEGGGPRHVVLYPGFMPELACSGN